MGKTKLHGSADSHYLIDQAEDKEEREQYGNQ